MPNSDMHKLFSKLIMGKYFGKIDKVMDSPAWMPVWHTNAAGKLVFAPLGPNHRSMYHTPLEAAVIGMAMNKENPMEGAMAGMFHIALDKMFDGLLGVANMKAKKYKSPYKKRTTKKKKRK